MLFRWELLRSGLSHLERCSCISSESFAGCLECFPRASGDSLAFLTGLCFFLSGEKLLRFDFLLPEEESDEREEWRSRIRLAFLVLVELRSFILVTTSSPDKCGSWSRPRSRLRRLPI